MTYRNAFGSEGPLMMRMALAGRLFGAFTGIVPIAAPRWELDILVEHPIYIAPANPNWICNAAGQ
jgi:hypothetical protein